MNQPTPIRPAMRPAVAEHPETTLHRHAAAMAEIQTMRDNYEAMSAEVAESRRTIDKLENAVDMLKTALDEERHVGRVTQRKLIRLAGAMSAMSRLAAEADVIMRDAKEFEEAEGKEPEQSEEEQ
jgi:hypothetical protein